MSPRPITQNTLFYGDNLNIMREHIPSESIDLIYLDPPFNSNRNYNVLFKDEHGSESEAQITAFEDTWHWNTYEVEATYNQLVTDSPDNVGKMIESLYGFIGRSQMMAYLVMMATRLIELHRVLKPTGSIYLHCDPTASHYLKIILDGIFGTGQFRNEVVWKRTFAHGSSKRYGPIHDVILFYSKSDDFLWTDPHLEANNEYLDEHFKLIDPASGRRFQAISLTGAGIRTGESGKPWRGINPTDIGRHWAIPGKIIDQLGIQAQTTQEKLDALDQAGLIYWPRKDGGTPRLKHFADEVAGVALADMWADIPPISAHAAERLGYPTQKPLALLERIIQASSNKGDIVLDPFCGCGTAIAAAQKLERKWIGIDITHLAIALQKYRMEAMFPGTKFKVVGEPKDIGAARQLSLDDRYQFQWWSLSLIRARPLGGETGSKEGKKGADKGIDGVIAFIDDSTGKAKRVIVQVKSGHVNRGMIGELVGTIQREKAAIGVFITLDKPTREMIQEAIAAGFYHSDGWNKDYPKIQIVTIEELLHGAEVKMPPQFGTFKQAQKVQPGLFHEQAELELYIG